MPRKLLNNTHASARQNEGLPPPPRAPHLFVSPRLEILSHYRVEIRGTDLGVHVLELAAQGLVAVEELFLVLRLESKLLLTQPVSGKLSAKRKARQRGGGGVWIALCLSVGLSAIFVGCYSTLAAAAGVSRVGNQQQ